MMIKKSGYLSSAYNTLLYILITAFAASGGLVTNTNDAGAGSLRQLIADAVPGETITFTNTLAGQTITLSTGQLSITNNLIIDASFIGGITIDGNSTARIFEISASTNTFKFLTLQNGSFIASIGGAIHINTDSDLTLHHCTLADNVATEGGGIYNAGAATLFSSTLSGNYGSAGAGGGIANVGTLTIDNSTLSGNSANYYGGGIYNKSGGTLTISNSTLSNNQAGGGGEGGGIKNSGTLTLFNSIVAGNTAGTSGPNISGSIASGTNNLTSGDPILAPLGDYGGPTQTMPPLYGSPAIDAGTNTVLLVDQRGLPRNDGMPDIGAVEIQPTIVLNTNDSGSGSLRQALTNDLFSYTITFTNSLAGQTITLTNGHLTLERNLNIDASSIGGITIDANSSSRIFYIESNTTNTLDSLILVNGVATNAAPNDRGGAISINPGAYLALNNSILAGNTAKYGGGLYSNLGNFQIEHTVISNNSATIRGGGIYNNLASYSLHESSIVSNTAGISGQGGGIYNHGGNNTISYSTIASNVSGPMNSGGSGGGVLLSNGIMSFDNSTIANNSCGTVGINGGNGGGIFNGGTLIFNQTTCSGNLAGDGSTNPGDGGGVHNNGIFHSTNSIIAGNFVYPGGTGTNVQNALTSDVSNLTDGDPQLAPLGDYGGPTLTLYLLPGSPAIDAGLTFATNSLTDQRGMPRVLSGSFGSTEVDIGAVEYAYGLVGVDLSGIDSNMYLVGAVYDSTTILPAEVDPDTAGMLEIVSVADKQNLVNQGVDQGIASVTNNPNIYGLYTESAFQALALDRPFLTHNAASNTFTLTIGILHSPDLVNTAFSNLTGFAITPYPEYGEIDITFDPPNSEARFFQIYGAEPAP